MHGLIFETSVCYWQNQPGYYLASSYAWTTAGDREGPGFEPIIVAEAWLNSHLG
jgi:hypothetical protein